MTRVHEEVIANELDPMHPKERAIAALGQPPARAFRSLEPAIF
jgi:hypothetical protein